MASRFRFIALFTFSAAALLHCSSSKPGEPPNDAGADATTPEAGTGGGADSSVDSSPTEGDDGATDGGAGSDADATTTEGASPDATSGADADANATSDADAGATSDADAADGADATPPCVVRTSGTDGGILDPTFAAFTWVAPTSQSIDFSSPPQLALGPSGDAYVAIAVTAPGAGASYVAVMHVQRSGALDTAFGKNGLVTLASWTTLSDILVDHTGDIVVTGTTPASTPTTGAFGLTALHSDGSVDFTVDPVSIGGGTQPCAGCIVDGADGYLTPSYLAMFNVARTGVVSQTDVIPPGGEYFTLCRMARGTSTLSMYCGYGGAGGGKAMRYDLHGVLDKSFAQGGAYIANWNWMFAPWAAAAGSLYISAILDAQNTLLLHFLANGSLDPTYLDDAGAWQYSTNAANPVLMAAPRCDGTELLVEQDPASGYAMETVGPSGPALANAGTVTVPEPDGAAGTPVASAVDAQGAILSLYQMELTELQLVRILPSR